LLSLFGPQPAPAAIFNTKHGENAAERLANFKTGAEFLKSAIDF
jgi:hypothetical protein